MRSFQIKAALEERGLNLQAIANQLGVNQQVLSYVANRKTRSARIEAAIAAAIDKPLHIVFPDRYQPPADWVEPEMTEIPTAELRQIRESLVIATQTIDRLCAA
jgi:lambda repressor-like predicted transcriptional regulator